MEGSALSSGLTLAAQGPGGAALREGPVPGRIEALGLPWVVRLRFQGPKSRGLGVAQAGIVYSVRCPLAHARHDLLSRFTMSLIALAAPDLLVGPTCLACLVLGCGPSGAEEPPSLLPAEESGLDVRELGPGVKVSIAPYVVDIGETAVTLAWTSSSASVGEARLIGEDGVTDRVEAAATRHHRIRFEGLAPGSTYRYEVGGIHSGNVRTPRLGATQHFAVFGHPGGSAPVNSHPAGALAQALVDVDPDFVLCTGDLCYFTSEASFDELFIRPFSRLFQRLPIYPAAGNHDGGFPAEYAWDYSIFRRLFPHDYASERGAYYSFVRGNVHFLSVAYHSVDSDDLADQLAWIERELRGSRSEFRLAFLGGANPPRNGSFDQLADALVDGGVDAIFGGDGSGSHQRDLRGADYFFAGTNGGVPADFYDVEVRPYEVVVRLRNAALGKAARAWTLRSEREKVMVRNLLPMAKEHPQIPRAVELQGIGLRSTAFHGLRVSARNPHDKAVAMYVRWGPRPANPRTGAGRMFREQAVQLPPEETTTFDVALPARNPINGEPWTLDELEVRIESPHIAEDYQMIEDLLELALFSDPLAPATAPSVTPETGR